MVQTNAYMDCRPAKQNPPRQGLPRTHRRFFFFPLPNAEPVCLLLFPLASIACASNPNSAIVLSNKPQSPVITYHPTPCYCSDSPLWPQWQPLYRTSSSFNTEKRKKRLRVSQKKNEFSASPSRGSHSHYHDDRADSNALIGIAAAATTNEEHQHTHTQPLCNAW